MKVLFVANGGGHLKELLHLSERLPFAVDESLWVTFDSSQSRSLLEGRRVRYVHYSSPRDGRATVLNLWAAARILTAERFDVAISTGATVAVSFLPLARLLGVSCYYIESATRTDGPSLTGRLLERVPGIRLYTQHPSWAGRRWSYAGSVFDQFESDERAAAAAIARAVVTVGASETYGFDRLIRALVPLFPADTEVVWQTGCADVDGLGIDARRQIPARELEGAMGSADVVVSHAGVGSALSALEAGRMPILVPRESGHGEHVDDHQFAIADELSGRGLALGRRVEELTGRDLEQAAAVCVRETEHPAPLAVEVPTPRAARRRGRVPARTGKPRRPTFLAWGAVAGRSAELAQALDADVLSLYPPGAARRPRGSVRYLVSSVLTTVHLVRHRPSAVIVTNPPIIPVLQAVIYGLLTGRPVVIDDHPGAFGAQGYRIGQRMLPVHRRLVPLARLCLVTDQSWVDVVESWGGRGLVLHEAPGDWSPVEKATLSSPPRLLFVCTFAPDEPVHEVVEAAAMLPEVEFTITGDLTRKPDLESTPNVHFVGFLDQDGYRAAVEGADLVLALTTEPTSAMRAAFEAVWAERVLVVNDWPLLKDLFPEAVHVANTADSIALGIRAGLADHQRLLSRAAVARRLQLDRWETQIAALRRALGPSAPSAPSGAPGRAMPADSPDPS